MRAKTIAEIAHNAYWGKRRSSGAFAFKYETMDQRERWATVAREVSLAVLKHAAKPAKPPVSVPLGSDHAHAVSQPRRTGRTGRKAGAW